MYSKKIYILSGHIFYQYNYLHAEQSHSHCIRIRAPEIFVRNKRVEEISALMNIRTTELLEKYKIEANYKRKRETNAQEVVSERKREAKAALTEEAKAARTEAVKAARAKEEKDQIEETEREGGPEAAAVKADGAKEEKGEQPEEALTTQPLEGPINASPVKKLWRRLSDIFDTLAS